MDAAQAEATTAEANTLVAVVTTVATREDALQLAHKLLERRLVACAQISAIESVYVWEGRVAQEPEYRLMLKTTAARLAAVQQALAADHPYRLPQIVAWPLQASTDYADWVRAAVVSGA